MNNNNICKICDGIGRLITNKDNITSIKICNNCNGEGESEFGEPIYETQDSCTMYTGPCYTYDCPYTDPTDVLLGIKNSKVLMLKVDSSRLKF